MGPARRRLVTSRGTLSSLENTGQLSLSLSIHTYLYYIYIYYIHMPGIYKLIPVLKHMRTNTCTRAHHVHTNSLTIYVCNRLKQRNCLHSFPPRYHNKFTSVYMGSYSLRTSHVIHGVSAGLPRSATASFLTVIISPPFSPSLERASAHDKLANDTV